MRHGCIVPKLHTAMRSSFFSLRGDAHVNKGRVFQATHIPNSRQDIGPRHKTLMQLMQG